MCLQDQVYKGNGARQLQETLTRERKSIVNFLTALNEETFTPVQEAWLDAESPIRPWWPDVFAMCDALAVSHGQPPVGPLSFLMQLVGAHALRHVLGLADWRLHNTRLTRRQLLPSCGSSRCHPVLALHQSRPHA